MGLAEVQQVLARLSIDRALRDRFFADPAATAAEMGLAPGDARVLAQIPKRQVEQFADSLRRKRRDQVRRVIPLAARALGRQFAALFDRYLDESPPRGSSADIEDAAGFVAAIRRLEGRLEPDWAIDLARYELARRQSTRAGRLPIVRLFRFPVARLAARPDPGPLAPRATIACWWRPSARANAWHVAFSSDFLRPLLRSGRPSDLSLAAKECGNSSCLRANLPR